MKKIILGLALIAGIISACSEDKIDYFSGQDCLQFVKPMSDSINVSFLFYPGETSHKIGLPLYLIGRPADVDREYTCEVLATGIDDAPKAAYKLPEKFVFAANATTDTLWLTCNLLPEMDSTNYRLVLILKESDNFGLGSNGYNGAIIRITNILAKPAWWTNNAKVTSKFLGAYSDAKYRKFIEVTGAVDFDSFDYALLREYTNTFKRYLESMKAAGTPVLEDDGTEMTVKMTL